MAKMHNMASGDHTISGKPSEYFTPTEGEQAVFYPESDKSGRGAGGPIMAAMPASGGTPSMRCVSLNYPISNVSGIRGSINDGERVTGGMRGVKVNPEAPQRNPVNGTNPSKPIQRKPKR